MLSGKPFKTSKQPIPIQPKNININIIFPTDHLHQIWLSSTSTSLPFLQLQSSAYEIEPQIVIHPQNFFNYRKCTIVISSEGQTWLRVTYYWKNRLYKKNGKCSKQMRHQIFNTQICVKVMSWQLTAFLISALGSDNIMKLILAIVYHSRLPPIFGRDYEGLKKSQSGMACIAGSLTPSIMV